MRPASVIAEASGPDPRATLAALFAELLTALGDAGEPLLVQARVAPSGAGYRGEARAWRVPPVEDPPRDEHASGV